MQAENHACGLWRRLARQAVAIAVCGGVMATGCGQAGAASAGQEVTDGSAAALVAALRQAQDQEAWRAFAALLHALPEDRRAVFRRAVCGAGVEGAAAGVLAAFCAQGDAVDAQTASARPAPAAADGPETPGTERAGSDPLTGALDLGASLASGDTDERALSARLKARQQLGRRWEHQLAVEADWGRSDGLTTQKRLVGDHRLFYGFNGRLTVFQFLRGEYDPFSGFDYRITESVGIGYDAVSRTGLTWHLEGGPGIRFIALADSPALRQEPIARLSSELSWAIAPNWTLENDTGAFLGGEGSTLENTIALEARINGALFGRISFNLRYDTKELAGDSKLDSLTKFSIGYRF